MGAVLTAWTFCGSGSQCALGMFECTQSVPVLRRFSLRFSGHSLGAGTAAAAVDMLHRHPARYPGITSRVAPSQITCFAIAPPPTFSLRLAREARQHTTSLVLGHDVVARASIANFQQLQVCYAPLCTLHACTAGRNGTALLSPDSTVQCLSALRVRCCDAPSGIGAAHAPGAVRLERCCCHHLARTCSWRC